MVALFGRQLSTPFSAPAAPAPKPVQRDQYDPLGIGQRRHRGVFGRIGQGLSDALTSAPFRREDGSWRRPNALEAMMYGAPALAQMRAQEQDIATAEMQRRRGELGIVSDKQELSDAAEQHAARERYAAGIEDPRERDAFRLDPEPYLGATAPLSRADERRFSLDESQLEEQRRHNRASESIDWQRASNTGVARFTPSERRQWQNQYNDDVQQSLNALGNLRTSLPYAQEVLRSNGNPSGDIRQRAVNDVGLLRGASRAQTGPGVLTAQEVAQTLSPTAQRLLMGGAAYADMSDRLTPEDRVALARFAMRGQDDVTRDLWRRYEGADATLSAMGHTTQEVGIEAPEYTHPEDMRSFRSVPESSFQVGHEYQAPSGRSYEYTGNGQFRFRRYREYDPRYVVGGGERRNPDAQPDNIIRVDRNGRIQQ